MLANAKVGQRVKVRYSPKRDRGFWDRMPLQGKAGEIIIAGRGRPRNHGVLIDGTIYVVPCGNLNREG